MLEYKFVSIELDAQTSKHLAYHFVPVNGYRECISYSAFFNPLKKRYITKCRRFTNKSLAEFNQDREICGKMYMRICGENPEDNVPRIEHDSLCDFFKHIGYDRKLLKIVN